MTASEVGTRVVVEVVKMKLIQIMAGLTSKRVDYESPMSRDTFHPCHYARSMKANLLDDGIGGTLVSPAFDDVALIRTVNE
jgi:hypothetical protein